MKKLCKNIYKLLIAAVLLNSTSMVFSEPIDFLPTEDQSSLKEYVLSLDEISKLALQNNFEIQLAKYDALIARTDEGVSKSIYDTIIEAEIKYRDDQSKQASTLIGTKSVDNDYNVSLSKKLPSGTKVTLDSTNNRNWSNSSFVTLNPNYESSIGITVEQDLGKNFFGIQDRGNVKITQIDIQNSEFAALSRIESNLSDVQKAYWDLVLQNEVVHIQEKMVDDAKALFDLNQEKIQDGLIESPDLLASEANYKEKVNKFILAKNQLEAKENVLKLLLNIPDNARQILPAESMILSGQQERLDESLSFAFENRYDYKEAHKVIDAKDIKLKMSKNNLWPEIDLTASLARNGVADQFSEAYKQVSSEDNPDLFAGIKFTLPIENRKAKSEYKASGLEKAKALLSLKLLERQISIGIIDQVRLCNVLNTVAINAVSIADIQTKKLEAEQKRFKHGRSDTDTIIRYQNDSLQAKLDATEAKLNYYVATIDLRRAEGGLLTKYWNGEI